MSHPAANPVASSASASPAERPLVRPASRARLSESLAAKLQMSPRSGERLQQHVDEDGNEFVLSSADGQLSVRLRLSLQREALEHRAGDSSVLIDWSRSTIACGRRQVALSRTELRLLAALLEDDGKCVSHSVIIGRVWPASALTTAERENALAVYVCTLRKRLTAVGLGSALQTARGVGYRFVL
jgi:hypothetical protein